MKKITLTIPCLIYMMASFGTIPYFHYCMSKQDGLCFAKASLEKKIQSVNEKNDCSNSKQIGIKTRNEHQSSQFIHSCNRRSLTNRVNLSSKSSFICNTFYVISSPANSSPPPPESIRTTIFMRNCVFLI
jgi:hypothetical protein